MYFMIGLKKFKLIPQAILKVKKFSLLKGQLTDTLNKTVMLNLSQEIHELSYSFCCSTQNF